ncbi:MAG: hypothetical protein RBU30_26720, partial [Polyangia bacterium]|nr:hypothetical protein [Polyangia bacterium]
MTRAARGFCQASLPCLLLAAAASCSQGGNAPQDNANQTPDSAVEVQPDAGQVQPDAQVTDMCDPEPIQVGVEQSAPAWASAQLAATAAFESALDSFYEKFVEPSTGCLMNPGFSWYNWDDVLEGPAVHSKFLSIAGRQDQRETHALIYKCYHQRAINDGFFDPDDAFYIPHYDAEHQMEGLMHLWSAVDLGPEDPELAEIVLQQSEWLISSEATHESGVFRASRLGVGGLSVQGADVLYNLGFVSPVIRAWMLTGDERFRQWVLDYTGAWASAALTEPEEFQGILPCQIDSETLEPGPFSDGNWWSCVGTNLDGWDWSQYGIAAIGRSTHGAIWGERLADARSMKLAEAMRTTLERFLHATTPPSDGYCPETGTFCR